MGAEHPRHRINHVGLARTVRSHDHSDPRFEFERGRISEGLKSLHGQPLQVHRSDPTNAGEGPLNEGSRLDLTVFTEEGGAAVVLDPDNGLTAPPTRFTFPGVDLVKLLVVPWFSVQIDKLLVSQC